MKHSSTEINKDLYNKISILFNIALSQARQPNEKTTGLDGETSYLNTTIDGVVKSAETWSPDQTSHMRQLVNFVKSYILLD